MGKKDGSIPLTGLLVGAIGLVYVLSIFLFFASGLKWNNSGLSSLYNNPSIFILAFGGNINKYMTSEYFPSVTGVVWIFVLQIILMVGSLAVGFCGITGRIGGRGLVFSTLGLGLVGITSGVLALNIKNLCLSYDKYAGLLGGASLGVGAIIYAVLMFLAGTVAIFIFVDGVFGTHKR